ncbi:MAG: arginine N-succinyltransferase [Bradymonadaceae bacterium]|nr:arginine N-succinyltransferase [Lujinxingiaceae bacterium]
MFLLREVHHDDLDALEELARHLNTLNLPADRAQLEKIIEVSQASFSERIEDIKEREYVFVLCDEEADRIIGTAMIIAQHGTYRRPSVYFNVRKEQKYSETLNKYFVHQVLQLNFNYEGPTEIGGLILHPDSQGHPQRLGKLLSFVRFLFIGVHRDWFREAIIAELLPPLNADGTSDLWDCLGANFTGLDYTTADKLSRENVEFIRSLFPQTPIYTSLLPERVRSMIGQVGAPTKPVEKMLKSIGFQYENSIDPFDGGPTFGVPTDQCELIKRTHRSSFAGLLLDDEQADGQALVGHEHAHDSVRFRAVLADYKQVENGYLLRSPGLHSLLLEQDAIIALLVLSGPGMASLY